ncbi:MAG: hypothetical protein L3J89_05750 [Gammaproteobacteria bacterium]|nr:hypothetical protein [Gammaproteobacteria bacterium]
MKKYKNEIFSVKFITVYSSIIMGLFTGVSSSAFAAATLMIDDEKSISMALGLRGTFSSIENSAPNGRSSSKSFDIDSISIYLDGRYNDNIKMTFNVERDIDDKLRVMDAIAKFNFHDNFNVWLGRMHTPGDRSNLSGPFFTNVWEPAVVVSRYPHIAFGRDNGLLLWGKPFDGKLVYSAGIFNGHNCSISGSNDSDNLLYAARISLNLFDPEPLPAYYVSNTYYGDKRILTIGAAYQTQKDGIGLSPTDKDDFQGWNVDFLFEDTIATGVLTVEGAYYDYDLSGQVDCASGEPGSIPCANGTNMGNQIEGTGYLSTLAYLIPHKTGIGNLQPFIRQQKFDRKISQTTNEQTDLGINYVIQKHNARISVVYSQIKDDRLASSNDNIDKFLVGFQLQY